MSELPEFQEESVEELFVPPDEAIPVTAEETASLGVAQAPEDQEPHLHNFV